eukprot:TRINITY_DN1940_c5_g1_i1.p1 TRINITY_DN1940_c5_g1~~TRINITY_DN1940_c5_g1_i1.p1  ORF type:complete len:185 (+),score=17.03 TRINITY_DN1940_c5_g1_i1:55-609(+)
MKELFIDDGMQCRSIIKNPEREVLNNKKINRVLGEKTVLYQTAKPGCIVRYEASSSGKEISILMYCAGEINHVAKKIIQYDRPILEVVWKEGHINKAYPHVAKAMVAMSPDYEAATTSALPILHIRLEPVKSTPRPDTYQYACLVFCPLHDGLIIDLKHSSTPRLAVHRLFETEIEEVKTKKGK